MSPIGDNVSVEGNPDLLSACLIESHLPLDNSASVFDGRMQLVSWAMRGVNARLRNLL